MLFGVIAGKAENWGAHLPKGDLPEGAGTEVSGTRGSHGKSEVVGSNRGGLCCLLDHGAVTGSFWIPAAPRGAGEGWERTLQMESRSKDGKG